MRFIDKLLAVPDPLKEFPKIAELLATFVVDFPDEDNLNGLVNKHGLDEADAARIRFTMSIANVSLAITARQVSVKEQFPDTLIKHALNEKLSKLKQPVNIGDYVRDSKELITVGSCLQGPSTGIEEIRERKLYAATLFEVLGGIRVQEYALALTSDFDHIAREGFPAFSERVATHYVGSSLVDAHNVIFMNRLAASLNEIYRNGFNALTREIKTIW